MQQHDFINDITQPIPYYQDLTRISNSNLGNFIEEGPSYLHDVLTGKVNKKAIPAMKKGTITHSWILEKDKFWNEYCILDQAKKPTTEKQIQFAKEVASSTELDEDKILIDAYRNNYSCGEVSDEKILVKATELRDKLANFIQYLKLKNIREEIQYDDLDRLNITETNIRKHKLANKLMYDIPETTEAHNEFHINWEFPKEFYGIKVKCKSLIDRVLIDHFTKTITLIDLKTTVKLNKFRQSVESLDYCRQLAYYWLAIQWYMLNVLNINVFTEGYNFKTYIVAVSTNGNYNVRVFEITDKQLEDRLDTILSTIEEIAWHQTNDLWEYTKDYYEGDGAEGLEL